MIHGAIPQRYFELADRYPEVVNQAADFYWQQAHARDAYLVAVWNGVKESFAEHLNDDDACDVASAIAYRVNQRIGRQAAAEWGVSP